MIRYDKKINNEINRIVRNYNAKINRVIKKDKYNIYYVPQKITAKDIQKLKTNVVSRRDLTNRLKDIELYTKRNAEQYISKNGQSISRYQYNVLKRNKAIALRRLNKKIKYFETNRPTSSGIQQSTTFAQSGNQEYLNTVAKKRRIIETDIMEFDNLDIDKFINFLQVNTKLDNYERWKNNYLQMVKDVGESFGVNTDNIINNLEKLSPTEINKLTTTESTLKQIIYYYKALSDLGIDLATENLSKDVESIFNDLNENLTQEIIQIL